jgi:hypothetical protein
MRLRSSSGFGEKAARGISLPWSRPAADVSISSPKVPSVPEGALFFWRASSAERVLAPSSPRLTEPVRSARLERSPFNVVISVR